MDEDSDNKPNVGQFGMQEVQTGSSSTTSPLLRVRSVPDQHMIKSDRYLKHFRTRVELDTLYADMEDPEDNAAELDKKDLHNGTEEDPNIVTWDGPDDPNFPMNWPFKRKFIVSASYIAVTFADAFLSAIFSAAVPYIAYEFNVSTVVANLGVSLTVLGYGFGPVLWAGLSELYGRRYICVVTLFISACFQAAVATAENIQTIMICRFFGGLFASAPFAVAGGAVADVWDNKTRGVAMCLFSATVFIGPLNGPIIGSFVAESYLGWRWTEYLTVILMMTIWSVVIFTCEETFSPALLRQKARILRYETGNWALHAKVEERRVDLKQIVTIYISRPLIMLVHEPMILGIALYMSLIYGIFYGLLSAFPFEFAEIRGWPAGVACLSFIPLLLGIITGAGVTALFEPRYRHILEKHGGMPQPEERTVTMMIGAVCFPVGMFIFAWTSEPSIFWLPSMIGIYIFGSGISLIFLASFNFAVDAYLIYAASAMAALTFSRSLFGAGFPLFTEQMLRGMTVHWACTMLALIAVALSPIPFIFRKYGPKLRIMSKFAPSQHIEQPKENPDDSASSDLEKSTT